MMYSSLSAAREASSAHGGHCVVVVDCEQRFGDPAESCLPMLTIESRGGDPVVVIASGEEVVAQRDRLSYAAALSCAQRLAGCRFSGDTATSGGTDWQHLVGITDIESFSPTTHRTTGDREFLRVPLGVDAGGSTAELDIKEAAANGMGPHGLCVGATGSGKSELLRTVALGMIVGHSSEELNLVLVDFKGGATFAGLEPAPHVAAVITNLADKAALVSRMRDALMGEMNRRQEVLRAAGDLDGIRPTSAGGAPAPAWIRCRSCSSSLMNSPNCSANNPISLMSSSRSDDSDGRWASIFCWPASDSTKAGCVVWNHTCPTECV